MAQFMASKTVFMDGSRSNESFDLRKNGDFFGTVHVGHEGRWCFTDACDERKGYKVRSLITRRFGRYPSVPQILQIIRDNY